MTTALGWLFLLGLQVVFFLRHHPPYFEDDAAFFLRYAENLAAGHGYRWNVEEPPVWGASAPLWPLLLAGGVKLGLTAAQASQLWSWILSLAATAVLGWVAQRAWGVLGLLALAPLLAINHLYSTWATSGMESPLTFLLIACALAAACPRASPPRTGGSLLGLVAGLCLVHKVDLAPLGLALLAGTAFFRRGHLRHAALVASGVALLWYGFALWHFGSLVPNSFMRKLTANWGEESHGWFVTCALLEGAGEVRVPLMLLGLFALRKQAFLGLMAAVQVLAPSIGYSLKPPSEEFVWYAAAVSPALAFLAAGGLALLLAAVAGERGQPWRAGLAGVLLVPLGLYLFHQEIPRVRRWHAYLSSIEPPLIEAGRWIDRHAPREARVLASWGNVAHASRRFVYDGTFLNRPVEKGSLVSKYAPEVLVGSTWTGLEKYAVPGGYRVVQSFQPPASSSYRDFCVPVLFRSGVPVLDDSSAGQTSAPEQRKRAAQARRELIRRLSSGEPVEPSQVSEELLQDLEHTLAVQRRRLANLTDAERRRTLEKALDELAAKVAELRARGR